MSRSGEVAKFLSDGVGMGWDGAWDGTVFLAMVWEWICGPGGLHGNGTMVLVLSRIMDSGPGDGAGMGWWSWW